VAEISCTPERAQLNAEVRIRWACTNADTALGVGFVTENAKTGDKKFAMKQPEDGKKNTFTVVCSTGTGAEKRGVRKSCDVALITGGEEQVAVTFSPGQPFPGERITMRWAIAGKDVDSCSITSPELPGLASEGVQGTITTTPISSGGVFRFQFTCALVGGGGSVRFVRQVSAQ